MSAARWLAAAVLSGCGADLDVRNFRVERERVLAVIAEPAEGRPGQMTAYRAIAVGPSGRLEQPAIRFSYCSVPKPLDQNGSFAAECTSSAGVPLAADGARAFGPIPADACRVHGPDPPPGDARPRDADGTGGYYQPLRLEAFGGDAVHLQRIQCNPRNVSTDVAREFSARYAANENPAPIRLALSPEGPVLPAGSEVSLRVSWEPAARESYAFVDTTRRAVTERMEGLYLDWFATRGELDVDRDAVEEGDARASSENRLRTPGEPGRIALWVVVHDSRGGTAVLEREIELR